MCFPSVIFVFFVVRYLSRLFNRGFPDNRFQLRSLFWILESHQNHCLSSGLNQQIQLDNDHPFSNSSLTFSSSDESLHLFSHSFSSVSFRSLTNSETDLPKQVFPLLQQASAYFGFSSMALLKSEMALSTQAFSLLQQASADFGFIFSILEPLRNSDLALSFQAIPLLQWASALGFVSMALVKSEMALSYWCLFLCFIP